MGKPVRGDAGEVVELLGEAPARLGRPLALVDGHGYAATWVHARVRRERVAQPRRPAALVTDVAGPIEERRAEGARTALVAAVGVSEPAAESRVERRVYVVRDDGVVFGDGADRPAGELGLEVAFGEPPRAARLWRLRGVEAYRHGARPDGAEVFGRLAGCYDAFVDFDRSIGTQAEMCELGACLSLATWLADAFPLVPYLWVTGERGSGKTQMGTVWALTSHMGEVVLASGTFAALRDLAELGAALYFDDAEALGGGRRGDGAKRELLLAGNRRGSQVALKVADGDGGWRTRWVSAYTPRAFSAIAPPEATLGSRAIVVPLTRTADAARGQRDPGDPASWPCDRPLLQDDLWALGLAWLVAAQRAWAALEPEPELVGREYEKWRPILAVARLVEASGVVGLEERIRKLMRGYQIERAELMADDETLEVIRGLVYLAERLDETMRAEEPDEAIVRAGWGSQFVVDNAALLEAVFRASPEGRLIGRPERTAATRMGQIMGRLRFERTRAGKEERDRGWSMSIDLVRRVARAHGVIHGLE